MSGTTTNTSSSVPCPAVTPLHIKPDELSVMESHAKQAYLPPGSCSMIPNKEVEWVRNSDGTPLCDKHGCPVSVDKILATKPLRHELSSRPGPGNRQLTYLSGDGVTRTLNDIFGYDGWNLDIKSTRKEDSTKDEKGRYHVAYTAMVRLTLCKSGTYKEDCGAGDAIDRHLPTAVSNALKASVTDAMKRAARHFGDKLGNSLYQGSFNMSKAPNTLQIALDQHEIERANTKFGFPKDRVTNNKMGATVDATATATTPCPPKDPAGMGPPPKPHSTTGNTLSVKAQQGSKQIQPTSTISTHETTKPHNIPSNTGATINQGAKPQLLPANTPSSVTSIQRHNSLPAPVNSSGQPSTKPMVTPQQVPTNTASATTHQSQNNSIRPSHATVVTKPPPSARESLEKSSLFSLSRFAAGNNRPLAENQTISINRSHLLDMDIFEKPRPGTSTGLHNKPQGSRGPMSGKRTSASQEDDMNRKRLNNNAAVNNPYLNQQHSM